MANKLLLTPSEINVYACSAIVSHLCNDRAPAEACLDRNNWPKDDLIYNLEEFLIDEFFWDVQECIQHAEAIYDEMLCVAQTVDVGIVEIEAAFVEAGAPVTE